ncbi:MAG: FecR domain-containing protein [Gammaproteobacteria bacterium]
MSLRLKAAVAIVSFLALGAGAWLLQLNGRLPWQTARYQTERGERWIAKLPDGSTFTLDAESTLEVRMLRTERLVHLLRGRAFFEVAKDPQRPFIVLAGDRRITSVGTIFEARLQPDSVRVLTVEGQVVVAPADSRGEKGDSPQEHLKVNAGEQFLAQSGLPASVSRTDVAKLTDWQTGRSPFSSNTAARGETAP